MRSSALLVLCALVTSGCAAGVLETAEIPETRDAGEFAGAVAFGFEASHFGPCGADEAWWIGSGPATGELANRYRDALAAGAHEVFARVRGTVSPRGQYGHLGSSQRELGVEEVLELRPRRPTDCPDAPVEVAPSSARVPVGDTLRLLAAAFDARGRELSAARVQWRSSDPGVASVDSLGRVVALQPGLARITASHGGRDAISRIHVVPVSSTTGYAVLRGRVTDAGGSPSPGEVFFSCGPGVWGYSTRTDAVGRYLLRLQPPDHAPYPFPDDRTVPCRVTAGGPDLPVGIAYAAVRFSLPGRAVDTTTVDIVRKPRADWLTLRPESGALLLGESLRLEAFAGGTPTDEVAFRSLIPSVAAVDERGVVTTGGYGTTVIVATSRRDTTVFATAVVSVPRHGPGVELESITRDGAPADTSRASGTLEFHLKLSLPTELAGGTVELQLDDQPVTSVPVATGFQRVVLRLDTTRFADGPHSVVYLLRDGSGREIGGGRFPITIENRAAC